MVWARRGERMPEEYGAAVGQGKDPVAAMQLCASYLEVLHPPVRPLVQEVLGQISDSAGSSAIRAVSFETTSHRPQTAPTWGRGRAT